jgi:hypothetical protein
VQVNAPFDVSVERAAAPAVLDEPEIDVRTSDGVRERPARPRHMTHVVATDLAGRMGEGGQLEHLHGSGARGDDGDVDSTRPGRWFTARGSG